MFHIVLYQPEIPPNTGNILRLSANAGCPLHLVEPLGYSLDDRQLKRAGMDYRDLAHVTVHPDWAHCKDALAGRRMFALTTRGSVRHDRIRYAAGDVFVFGPETAGLPDAVREEFAAERRIRLPMVAGNRSINLSNAVAITVYEAWRQMDFSGALF
ncbi:MAG: tRNA (cytidine(34)-2'-O)-methyltransferase [Proteobacteria bacterium]|nr:tRNA (cytidine(34)-2'-O)-methyltransferase [Pseudomonadota bacterium]HQR04212.1 tRNA (cytidine(34)-2'-O)-methyltransferase [Rhodocyclaceae bacterium]